MSHYLPPPHQLCDSEHLRLQENGGGPILAEAPEKRRSNAAPLPENSLSDPASSTLFGHSRREIRKLLNRRQHISTAMQRRVRRIPVNFFPSFSGHSPSFALAFFAPSVSTRPRYLLSS
ncbi:hypothetical protein I312_104761 [Cryptococcus bacillisporus CA1280]|uniref:uncharacterized protein n=1 Tax=Cryptococcus bacillisporus CA1280 TaxID=1296109 RepID=UPI003366F5D8